MKKLVYASLVVALASGGAACGDEITTSGPSQFVDVRAEDAGDNCTRGGVGIATGTDANGNGTLDDAEVDDVQYVCDATAVGNGGTDAGSDAELVAFMDLALGDAPCTGGGVAVLRGLDDDNDGVLDTDEVEQRTEVCSASGDAPHMTSTRVVPAGEDGCATGGIGVLEGVDADHSGTLDEGEIDETTVVCNGPAPDGRDLCAFPAAWNAETEQCVLEPNWTDTDLSGHDLSNIYLAGSDFSGSTLNGADLSWTDLRGAAFSEADLTGANLSHANVTDSDFSDAVLNGADLTGVDLRRAASLSGLVATELLACPQQLPNNWECVDLGATGLSLIGPGASLSGLDLSMADLSDFDLRGTQVAALEGCPADLPNGWSCLDLGAAGLSLVGPGVDLAGLDLTGADFTSVTNLSDVDLGGSILAEATFADNVDLEDANFMGADLTDVTLGDNADLRGTRLSMATLAGVDLSNTQLSGTQGTDITSCPQVLPSSWSCLPLDATGNTLVGPGANMARLDLTGADLSSQTLTGASLQQSDLTGADLRNTELGSVDLDDATLVNAVFDGADGQNTDFQDANAVGASFVGASLANADFQGADLQNADFSSADLDNAVLDDADLRGVIFDGADLGNADLQDTDLTGAHLSGAQLDNTDLDGSTLTGVTAIDLQGCPNNLPGAWDCVQDGTGSGTRVLVGPGADLGGIALDLSGVDLADSNLRGADLSSADLSAANLDNADLRDADLGNADLTGADLTDADLTGAELTGATTTGATWDNTTCPDGGNSDDNGGSCG